MLLGGLNSVVGPAREVYLHTNYPIRQDDQGNVTEIQFPVVRA